MPHPSPIRGVPRREALRTALLTRHPEGPEAMAAGSAARGAQGLGVQGLPNLVMSNIAMENGNF